MEVNLKIAILVSKKYYEENYIDDIILKQALESRGHNVIIMNWDNTQYDFSENDCAIIRSCWDYDQRVEEFLIYLENISKETQLINSFSILKENCSKTYLLRLKSIGIPIVESRFIHNLDDLNKSLASLKDDILILKPTISASGRNTHRLRRSDPNLRTLAIDLLKNGSIMIQPYLSSVESLGERSTVVINNNIVFTMLKKPAPGKFLVHNHNGGTYSPDNLQENDKAFIQNIISKLPDKTAYVRIDYLYDKGEAKLLELELIEPNLYLHQNPKGVRHLCDYIEKISLHK